MRFADRPKICGMDRRTNRWTSTFPCPSLRVGRRAVDKPGISAARRPFSQLLIVGILLGLASGPFAQVSTLLAQDTAAQDTAAQDTAAQDMAVLADPRDLGIRLSDHPVELADNDRVVVLDELEQPVVAKVYLRTGNRVAVILPSGRLIAVDQKDVTATDRPFEPLSHEDLRDRLLEGKFKGFKVLESRRYLFIYNSSDLYAETTRRILEKMYSGLYTYCRRQRIDVHEPEFPLVVIMFRTQEEFDRYREMPPGVVAYYNSLSNYVVMYEQGKLAEAAPMLAVKQSISTVTHEGVHQVLHNIGVQHRLSSWPAWISEGLPEFFSPTTLDRNVNWKGPGKVNDLRMYNLVERLKADDGSLGNGRLIEETIRADKLDANGYAASWALTYYLAEHERQRFFDFLREVSSLTPLQSDAPDSETLFRKHFGEDYASLQQEMLERLARLPYVNPVENQPHFVGFCVIGSRRLSMVSTSPRSVEQWQGQVLRGLSPAEQAQARFFVEIYANRAVAIQASKQGIQ